MMNRLVGATLLLISVFNANGSIARYSEIGEDQVDRESVKVSNKILKNKKNLEFIQIGNQHTHLIDIRAFGDSGWSWTHESPAMAPAFGEALDDFSPSGEIYRGDINFMNWESTIGYSCEQWHAPYVRGRSYAFLAAPENIEQAIDRGIENFSLSNNHTRDCLLNTDTDLNGQLTTIFYLNQISQTYPSLSFHGVSDQHKNKIKIITKNIKGINFKIAYASYYTGRESCPHSVCAEDSEAIISNFKSLDVDFKIMMIHSTGDQTKLVDVAHKFIKEANGDVVFGSGPHRWKPIRHVEKKDGFGIIFDSLGNFLHPSMAKKDKNIIARILVDPIKGTIAQAQAISVSNYRDTILPSPLSPKIIESNLDFTPKDILSNNELFKAMYFNF